jgi:hypothetical protein
VCVVVFHLSVRSGKVSLQLCLSTFKGVNPRSFEKFRTHIFFLFVLSLSKNLKCSTMTPLRSSTPSPSWYLCSAQCSTQPFEQGETDEDSTDDTGASGSPIISKYQEHANLCVTALSGTEPSNKCGKKCEEILKKPLASPSFGNHLPSTRQCPWSPNSNLRSTTGTPSTSAEAIGGRALAEK